MIAEVEGTITYENLVEETLRYGLIPAVVPQLKTITVGGAVSGLGIESSSFKYGLVHETVEEMEILTGTGGIVVCCAHENRELFFGFPNSYGTLGYALRLRIRLIPAKPFVHTIYTRFPEAGGFFGKLAELCGRGEIDFLDGVIFAKDDSYINRSFFAEHAPYASDYTYMNIYYRSLRAKPEDWLTSKGYVWRWDTDWFWCSKHFGLQMPAIRLFAKPLLNSRAYQRLMRLSQKVWPDSSGSESVIQDVQIPIEHAPAFCDFLLSRIGIKPIWVCPFRTSPQNFELCGLNPNMLYINFGFWDVISTTYETGHYNRLIEAKAAEFGGTKALYSTSYYTKDVFWNLYNQKRYHELKQTYDPESVFPDLYGKCIERK